MYMKKILLITTLALLAGQGNLFSQFKQLGSSETFAEPETGSAILLKGKNGQTYFLHFDRNKKINLKSYTAERQLIYERSIPYLDKGEKLADVVASFESNNQLIIFIESYEQRTPVLTRLVINGSNGKLVSEEEIARYRKMNMGDGYAMAFGKLPLPTFYIRKSVNSDHYAIALFNTLANDRNERIEIMHFDGNNKLINKAFYESPNDGYKYMVFRDLYVDEAKAVYVVATGYNTRKSGGDQSGGLFIGKLEHNAPSFNMKRLPFAQAKQIDGVILRYNPVSEQFIMLSNKATEKKKEPTKYIVNLSTFDKSIEHFESKALNFSSLNRIAQKEYKRKEKINAIPKALTINKDGSYTIVLEETKVKVTNHYSPTPGMSSNRVSYFLNDIGVVSYDKSHQVMATHYMPKSQRVNGVPNLMYYSFRGEKPSDLGMGMQYKSYQYLNNGSKSYILVNDIESNVKKMQKGKRVKTISGIGACEGFYYTVAEKGIPKGERVNSDKTGKQKTLLLFAVANYDAANNEYTVMETSPGKKSRIIWLRPE